METKTGRKRYAVEIVAYTADGRVFLKNTFSTTTKDPDAYIARKIKLYAARGIRAEINLVNLDEQ